MTDLPVTFTRTSRYPFAILLAALVLYATPARAQWELNEKGAEPNFVTIQNGPSGKVHRFTTLVGFIFSGGNAQLSINLKSAKTLVPVENETVQALLSRAVKFQDAIVTAQFKPEVLAAAAAGESAVLEVPFSLSLHGVKKELLAPLTVINDGEGLVRIYSTRDIVIEAADFGLGPAIETLRAVTGAKDISASVPITLGLSFRPFSVD